VRLGWDQNGDLLRLAEAEFQLFVTADQNIRYQQSLTGRRIAILELSCNDLRRIQAAAALLQSTVAPSSPASSDIRKSRDEQQQLHLMFLCQLDQRRKPHRAAEVHVQIGFRNATNEVGCDRALRVALSEKNIKSNNSRCFTESLPRPAISLRLFQAFPLAFGHEPQVRPRARCHDRFSLYLLWRPLARASDR